MYLAATNRKPDIEWLKQARGLFFSPNKKSEAKRSSDFPLPLCCPQPVAFGLMVVVWMCLGWRCICGGCRERKGNESCLLFQILPIYVIKGLSLRELSSVFLWPLFAIRDSVNVTSTSASPVEGGKEEGCWNAR